MKNNGIKVFCAFDKMVTTSRLKENPANPNTHPPEQIALLSHIIANQGWRNPIVVSNRSKLITKGHARLQAARALSLKVVPVDYQDYKSAKEELADMVADNRIAELAEIDRSVMRDVLIELDDGAFDMDLTGFDQAAIEELMTATMPESEVDAEPQIDKADQLRQKWGVERGQIWELGDHRLMCGDCTTGDDMRLLLNGSKAALVFTDPPYGVDYDGGTTVRQKLNGDSDTGLYDPCCRSSFEFSDDQSPLYLWFAHGQSPGVFAAIRAAKYEIRAVIIWNKQQAQFGALSAHYKEKKEPLIYAVKKGKTPRWFGPTNEVTVWDVDRASVNEFHPTQKPTELAARAIRNSSQPNSIIGDWFLGSGATLIACEQLNRKCRAMEIDPGYCAVSIQRWHDATSKTPKLLT
jgi:DNA modification methylase